MMEEEDKIVQKTEDIVGPYEDRKSVVVWC